MLQKQFGEAVRFYRNRTGLSQEKFARKIGMDRAYYASIEEGKRNVSLENIRKIADGLDVSLGELFAAVEYLKTKEE